MKEELAQRIQAIERALSPAWRADFAKRAAAMDELELDVLDRLRYLDERGPLPADLRAIRAQAAALHDRLESANERVLQRLRRRIAAGRGSPAGLQRGFARHAGPDGRPGYDLLDRLIAGLLDGGKLPDERAVREPEMVAYQPTPARAILTLIERAKIRPSDVFYDLGSGLGHVVLLVSLLCGARARGIEIEPVHCEYAERCARSLRLAGIELTCADAREATFTDGTVFFLYTPFRGAMLSEVLERIRVQTGERPIRVCTYGPCTVEVAAAGWLRPAEGSALGPHEVVVFHRVRIAP